MAAENWNLSERGAMQSSMLVPRCEALRGTDLDPTENHVRRDIKRSAERLQIQ